MSLVCLGYFSGSRLSEPAAIRTDEGAQAAPESAPGIKPVVKRPPKQAPASVKPLQTQRGDLAKLYRDIELGLGNPNGREILQASLAILQLDASEIEELLRNPKLGRAGSSRHGHAELLSACFARLAEIDPKNASKVSASLDSRFRNRTMETIFREWATSDPDSAIAASIEIKDWDLKKIALVQSIKAIVEDDPEKAFALALEHNDVRVPLSDAFTDILQRIAATDPLLALQKSHEIPLEGMMAERIRNSRERNIISQWSQTDPDGALAYIQQIEDESKKSNYTLDVIRNYRYSDPDKAFELLSSAQDSIMGTGLQRALGGLVADNPQKALKWINENSSGDKQGELLRTSISAWFQEDEEGVLAYYHALDDPELKKHVSSGMLSKFRYSDPEKFLSVYPEMTSGSEYDKGSFNVTLLQLASKDPTKAKEYYDKISDPELKAQALAPYLMGLMKTDPDTSFAMAEDIPTASAKKELQATIYPYLALSKPSLVAEAFSENGFQDFGSYQFEKFISTYSLKNITQAAELVNTMDSGYQRDAAIQSLIPSFPRDSQDSSMEWASAISNPDTRISTMKTTYESWKKNDPQQASEWLESTDLLQESTKSEWE